jgi:hypothetical protein
MGGGRVSLWVHYLLVGFQGVWEQNCIWGLWNTGYVSVPMKKDASCVFASKCVLLLYRRL